VPFFKFLKGKFQQNPSIVLGRTLDLKG